MKLCDLFEAVSKRKVLCIFPGGFHIFTAGHLSVYHYLKEKFPTADVYVASSNVTKERPFPFVYKQFLASQAGVPPTKFVEVQSPYRAMEITKNYDPKNTVLIFALSEKDKDRLGNPVKKDGSLSFMQPYPGSVDKCSTFDKHGYYVITPVAKFSILGEVINSASQIREMYKNASDKVRLKIARELYPASRDIKQVKHILDEVLVKEKIDESSAEHIANFISEEYPKIVDVRWIQQYIYKMHKQIEFDEDFTDRLDSETYALINISIDELEKTNDLDWDDYYKELSTPFPPIVINRENEILDGNHRASSAKNKGDKFIRAYVPINKLSEHIVKLKNGKYRLLSHKGKNLGTFNSHKAAAKHEGEVEYFKSLKESPASKSISKIVQGWILPDGKNLPLLKNLTHHKILNKFGMRDYYEAYNKGWIRVSIMELQSHDIVCLETTFPFKKVEDRLEKIARKIISQGKYNDFIAYCGSGNTYGRYDWDNGEFVKILPRRAFNESPDFNYSTFNNKDKEIKKLKWQVKKLIPSGKAVTIISTDPETVSSTGYVLARIILQLEEENGKLFRATVRQSGISPNWKGTGLGQMLYDKAIEFAKKKGCQFFCSDTFRTTESNNAWKRLSNRYPVEKHSNYYIIDLSKV